MTDDKNQEESQEEPQEESETEPKTPVVQDDPGEEPETASRGLKERKIEEQVVVKSPAISKTGLLAILLALVAIGIGSFAVYTLYKPRDNSPLEALASEMTGNLAKVQNSLQSNARDLSQVTNRLGDIEGRQSEALADLKMSLESRVADLQAATGTRSQDWIIAEVEYLLRMGNQRLLMERDPKGALALFKAADNIIAEAEGLTAFSLRKAMAADIASLEAVKMLDREGIYLRLSAYAGQVINLKQVELNYTPPDTATDFLVTSETTILTRLWNLVRKAGSRIASLIDFRRDQIRITPILPPSEEYFLQQNLILKLQVAQIALLESNQEIYSNSINESIAWIGKYYDPEDAVTLSIKNGLEALLQIDIQTEMPDVTASLRAVRDLLAGFHQSENKPQSEIKFQPENKP